MFDHAPLAIVIPIVEEHINTRKCTIVKDSKEEWLFIKDLSQALRNIDMSNIVNSLCLDSIINKFASAIENAWTKNSKIVNITVYSKSWWNTKCSNDLDAYRSSRSLEDWKQFKRTVKDMKWSFFDLKIQEISNKKRSSWELMEWVHKCKLPAVEAVKFNSYPCLEINNFWFTLHLSFNTASDWHVEEDILDKIPSFTSSS